jgi:hypothetical protein
MNGKNSERIETLIFGHDREEYRSNNGNEVRTALIFIRISQHGRLEILKRAS